MSQSRNDQSTDEDELKQDLDKNLSQVVHKYRSEGLSPTEIADSMLLYAEVAATKPDRTQSVEEYVET